MGTPDGSAGHPIVTCPEGQDVRSERVSADGVQDTVTLPDSSREHKALIPRSLGAGLALTPDEAFGWGQATFLPMRRVTYPFIFTFV